MTDHRTGTREQWRSARLELLTAEKELTRRGDELARMRRELPWVRIEKEYSFETDEGTSSLAELFGGRSQLLVYHFMLGPDYEAGCPSCSAIADGFNGFHIHLANHDVMLWAISRAPLEKLQAFKQRMGWTFPWASAYESDFQRDFQAHFTEQEQRDGDIVFESHGLKLLVDRESLQFVSGSTIDYEESLQGAGFKVNNPNVVAACGCGSSFRVAEEEQVSAV